MLEASDLKRKTENTYNAAADHYDDTPLGFWDRAGQRTVERLGLLPGASVLDVGCGSGASAIPAAEAVGASGRVIGIDLAQNLLNLAERKAHQKNLNNVDFYAADMTQLTYPDAHFDAVISVFSIFFVADMEAQVAKLWRLVKPGGQLAVTTWASFLEPVYTVWREAIQSIRPDLYSAFNPWDRIVTVEAVQKLMRDAGLPQLEVIREASTQSLNSPEDFWTILLGNGTRATIEAMSEQEAIQVKNHLLNWIRTHHVGEVETHVIYALAIKG
jgi:ubiquinone/menaquinone biosynthesis C-methylase UbiE